jgi:hypothetical protein
MLGLAGLADASGGLENRDVLPAVWNGHRLLTLLSSDHYHPNDTGLGPPRAHYVRDIRVDGGATGS